MTRLTYIQIVLYHIYITTPKTKIAIANYVDINQLSFYHAKEICMSFANYFAFQKMRKTNVYSTYKDYFLHCYFTSSKKKIVATLNILFMVWSLPNSMCCLLPTKHILKKENDVFLRFRNVIKDRFSVAALLLCVFFSIPY